MEHLHFPRSPSPTFFCSSSRNSVQLWLNSLATARYCPVQPLCVCPVLLTLTRNPLKSSALYLCVWPYSKLGPNPLPPLLSSIYSTLLKDKIRSLFCHISCPHHLAFTSSSGKSSEEKGTLAVKSPGSGLAGLLHIMGSRVPAGALPSPELLCWFLCIYPSGISYAPILPIPSLVRKKKCREWRQKGGHKAGVQLKEGGIKVEEKNEDA